MMGDGSYLGSANLFRNQGVTITPKQAAPLVLQSYSGRIGEVSEPRLSVLQ